MEAREPQWLAGRDLEREHAVVGVADADVSVTTRVDRRRRPDAVARLAFPDAQRPDPRAGGEDERDDSAGLERRGAVLRADPPDHRLTGNRRGRPHRGLGTGAQWIPTQHARLDD